METDSNWVKLMGLELIGCGCGELQELQELPLLLPLAGAPRSLDSY
jgi:hypothetical protein